MMGQGRQAARQDRSPFREPARGADSLSDRPIPVMLDARTAGSGVAELGLLQRNQTKRREAVDKVAALYRLRPAETDGVVAQLVEHHNGIVGVRGSNPLGSTIFGIKDLA